MISWIQKYFQHHFRVIFAVLLTVIIISFVFTIGAAPGIGNGERGAVSRPFFGLNLAAAADAQRIAGDAQLSAWVAYGASNIDGEQLQQFAFQRYASIALANSLHIPAPTPAELEKHIRGLRTFQGKDGQFDAELYNKFIASLKGNPRLRESEVFRVLADDARAELVQKLFAGPGYVLSSDVRRQLARADTQWALAIASVDYASYQPSITPSDAELTQFFTDNKFRYEQAAKFSGSQVAFPASAYAAKVTLSDEDLRTYFKNNKARFTAQPADAKAPAADDEAAFALAKPKVEAALRLERARRLALRDAADLSVALDDKKADAASLPGLLAAAGRSMTPVKPFARGEASAELGASPELSNEAFKLGKDRLFSDGIATPSGAVILVWHDTIPARIPELTEVRAKVLADYVAAERRKRFADFGKTLTASIQAALKAGKQFGPATEEAAAKAGVKVDFRTPAAFTMRQPARDIPYAVYGTLESLEKGQISDMVLNEDKGVIVYAAEKTAPALEENAEAFREARLQLSRMAGNTTGGAILGELVERELNRSNPVER